ncbi:hypothetical protein GH714_008494 [Hevea brasiliensis]|uniref:Phorbol-ester/DAG-type domain-containing protein n=1 Tax=Hevea brasiliensis TaxID=3981 RepID=A0A6A6LZQ9_HEVBR|nr:hypothetical protein GH714_008494 [Hevea brasiliensis]
MKYSEISHFSHPLHSLKFEYSEFPFKCDGCKEVGIGSRYKCSKCDFDLHMHCAIPSASIYHPFYTKCSFQFLSRPPGDKPRYCNACKRDVNGFLYHCKDCGFDLHPCCAKLPMVLDDGEVKLYLYKKVSATCHKCGRKGRRVGVTGLHARCNLHVACVKDMLVENWASLILEDPQIIIMGILLVVAMNSKNDLHLAYANNDTAILEDSKCGLGMVCFLPWLLAVDEAEAKAAIFAVEQTIEAGFSSFILESDSLL